MDTTESYDRYNKPSQIESVMKFRTSKDAFVWPRDNSGPPPAPRHEQNRSSTSSSGGKFWDSVHPSRPHPSHHHPSKHPNYKHSRSKPSHFDELLRDHMSRKSDSEKQKSESSRKSEDNAQKKHLVPNSSNLAGCSRKRRNSFKPNTEHLSSRWANISNVPKKNVNDQPPKRDKSIDNQRSASSETFFDSGKNSHPDTSECSGKVELKKSTIRSEITKILYKYNHDYITSKIVRTMLMQKFGCDLTPHKKYIDDTIMELLDIIDNNPINLKSIPGRVFVDEGEVEDLVTSPVSPAAGQGSESPIRSPMSANIDDISPFAIMGNQADEIALSNVDNSVNTNSSNRAWGDKSNSPKEKSVVENVTTKVDKRKECISGPEGEKYIDKDASRKYALTKDDKPINLCECCLCCFRIQTLEELSSLYNHVQTKHKSETTCVVCDIKFTDVYTLMLHVAEFHRGKDSLKCRKCRQTFNHHSELSKHWDFCYLSSESEDMELEETPVRTPRKKQKQKFQKRQPGMPELVNTLKSTQHTLNKIKTFITSEAGPYEPEDL